MNRLPYLKVIPIVVVMVVCLVGTQSIAGEEVCTSKGQIETIDCACNTVAVEVLLGDTYFTVTGPLCRGVVLEREGQPAVLADFSVGEQVMVQWRHTDKGDIIETLAVR